MCAILNILIQQSFYHLNLNVLRQSSGPGDSIMTSTQFYQQNMTALPRKLGK